MEDPFALTDHTHLPLPCTATLGDGTPMIIVSWTHGSEEHPIIGSYRSPRLPGNPVIVAQWNLKGEYAGNHAAKHLRILPISVAL